MKVSSYLIDWFRLQMEMHKWVSQEELAAYIDVRGPTVSRWFSRYITDISGPTVRKIAKAFNIDPVELERIAAGPARAVKETSAQWLAPPGTDALRKKLAEWIVGSAPREYLEMVQCAYRCHTGHDGEKGGSSSDHGSELKGQSKAS